MAEFHDESHRAPSAKPHQHTHHGSASPDPLHEGNSSHRGAGIAPPIGMGGDRAHVDKNKQPEIAVRRFKSGDLVTMRATQEKYVVSRTDYIESDDCWRYTLKDNNGIEYTHAVAEGAIKKRKPTA